MNDIKVLNFQDIPHDYTGRATNHYGSVGYFLYGRYHRLDGPAFIYPNSSDEPEFLIYGESFSQEQYWVQPDVIKFNINKKLKMIETINE